MVRHSRDYDGDGKVVMGIFIAVFIVFVSAAISKEVAAGFSIVLNLISFIIDLLDRYAYHQAFSGRYL
jgi:hypothetical protein